MYNKEKKKAKLRTARKLQEDEKVVGRGGEEKDEDEENNDARRKERKKWEKLEGRRKKQLGRSVWKKINGKNGGVVVCMVCVCVLRVGLKKNWYHSLSPPTILIRLVSGNHFTNRLLLHLFGFSSLGNETLQWSDNKHSVYPCYCSHIYSARAYRFEIQRCTPLIYWPTTF